MCTIIMTLCMVTDKVLRPVLEQSNAIVIIPVEYRMIQQYASCCNANKQSMRDIKCGMF